MRSEAGKNADTTGLDAVRPSRRPWSLSSGHAKRGPVGGLLRTTIVANAIPGLRHAEERPGAAGSCLEARMRPVQRVLAQPLRYSALAGAGARRDRAGALRN